MTHDARSLAHCIRFLAMDAVEAANSGHPGMPMGMADVATVLFQDFMRIDPSQPDWPDRDRFVLSAGHGSMLLYALGYLLGYPEMTIEQIKNFRQMGALTAGHPEIHRSVGIETTTGPLGQGLANAVGMAIAERLLQARFGDNLVNHYTYVIAGDGCLMEGISQEAITLAGHLRLNKLIVLFDDNSISIDGATSLSTSEDQLLRFQAAGWHTQAIDGHDHAAIHQAIATARNSDKPAMIACKTKIAYGAPTKAGTNGAHGSPLGKDEIAATRAALNWPHAPFVIPADLLEAWRSIGRKGLTYRQQWQERLTATAPAIQTRFTNAINGDLDAGWQEALLELKKQATSEQPKIATRAASGRVLETLVPAIPAMIGGSADLTGSNNTRIKDMQAIKPDDFQGRYLHWGIREHAMAAAMNGMALHGGIIPYSGTFLVFSDYCKPALRLASLMEQRVIHVFTHDSIGVGEDGPTHQPVEHLAMLRAIPNMQVFRPADLVETLECWALAISSVKTPSVLALTRQNLPTVRTTYTEQNLSAQGAYILKACDGKPDVCLIATGSEVHLALQLADTLAAAGVKAQVVSMPCWLLFDQQSQHYKNTVLPANTLKVAIEAASPFGWHKYIGSDGLMIGMEGFGASAPAEKLYAHFGFGLDTMLARIQHRLSTRVAA